jgi:AcrR family transcriptional regulator
LAIPGHIKLVDRHIHMARTHIDKRSRLVSAAVGLAYQNGFGATSLADIAREAEVPLGNVYYYFKTKDDIGDAIVPDRAAYLGRSWTACAALTRGLAVHPGGAVFVSSGFLATL